MVLIKKKYPTDGVSFHAHDALEIHLLIGVIAALSSVENGARNHFRWVSLCSGTGTSFDLNVTSDSFALASEAIWVSFLRVKTEAKYSC